MEQPLADPAQILRYKLRRPVIPSTHDSTLAREASRVLAPFANRDLRAMIGSKAEVDVVVPAAAMHALVLILTELARGNAVSILPVQAELTTQQAADTLGVSRPFLIKELEEKHLPYRKVGTHRRVLFSDLMRYKEEMDARRDKTLDDLTQQSQSLNMGY
jgi:excisionase family DNA binding protein